MNSVNIRKTLGLLCAVSFVLAAARLVADGRDPGLPPQQESQAQRAAPKPSIPLKVTVVIARYQGEKRTASLPFTLMLNTHDVGGTSLRMNSDVPIPSGGAPNSPVYQYKNIGTSIDCSAETTPDDGRMKVMVRISDSQVFSDAPGAKPMMQGIPSFQTFTSTSNLLLRDGQTVQYTTATDKASGEVVKVDVTLNVVK